MQVAVSQKPHPSHEVFGFFVCSFGRSTPDAQSSLSLDAFEWSTIRERIVDVLDACSECRTWDEVIMKLAPQLEYADK